MRDTINTIFCNVHSRMNQNAIRFFYNHHLPSSTLSLQSQLTSSSTLCHRPPHDLLDWMLQNPQYTIILKINLKMSWDFFCSNNTYSHWSSSILPWIRSSAVMAMACFMIATSNLAHSAAVFVLFSRSRPMFRTLVILVNCCMDSLEKSLRRTCSCGLVRPISVMPLSFKPGLRLVVFSRNSFLKVPPAFQLIGFSCFLVRARIQWPTLRMVPNGFAFCNTICVLITTMHSFGDNALCVAAAEFRWSAASCTAWANSGSVLAFWCEPWLANALFRLNGTGRIFAVTPFVCFSLAAFTFCFIGVPLHTREFRKNPLFFADFFVRLDWTAVLRWSPLIPLPPVINWCMVGCGCLGFKVLIGWVRSFSGERWTSPALRFFSNDAYSSADIICSNGRQKQQIW